MEKKYELVGDDVIIISNTGTILRRIRALKDFDDVKKGTLGGWIEKEENLSQMGDAWVYSNAKVYGNAKVFGNAKVRKKRTFALYWEYFFVINVYVLF